MALRCRCSRRPGTAMPAAMSSACCASTRCRPKRACGNILALRACETPPPALMLAKVGSAEEIALYDALLDGNCANIRYHVIVESTDGLANVQEIAPGIGADRFPAVRRGRHVGRPARGKDLGSAALCALGGGPRRRKERARPAGRPLAQSRRPGRAPRRGARRRRARFTGKAAIHPNQIPAINEIFSPRRRRSSAQGGSSRRSGRTRPGCWWSTTS